MLFFQVQRDAEHVVRKRQHLAGHHLGQSVHPRNAVAHADDRADFIDGKRLLVVRDLLAQNLADLVCLDIRHPWLLFRFQLLAQPDQLLAHRTIVDG